MAKERDELLRLRQKRQPFEAKKTTKKEERQQGDKESEGASMKIWKNQ